MDNTGSGLHRQGGRGLSRGREADIVIVGGGAAGLTTAGALRRRGLDALVVERERLVGTTWRRRYERLRLHTVRAFSGLAHRPIPRRYPRYLPKDAYADYLEEYVTGLDLDVEPASAVSRVAPDGARWLVETARTVFRPRVVVIATGQHAVPAVPDWPGRDTYRGRLIHSSEYRTGRVFDGQRVLVVGAGNSGAEIAAEVAAEGAAFVASSVRTAPPVVPRDVFGVPVQAFGIALSRLPPDVADRIGARVARAVMGDLSRYGLPPPAWHPFTARRIPVIDVGYVRELEAGRIHVRRGVLRLSATGAVYDDGREERFDAIVAATGFRTGLERLLDVPGLLDARGAPRFPSGRPTSMPGLYFMGFTESLRGILFEANRDSRRLARLVADYLAGRVRSSDISSSANTTSPS